MRAATSGRMTAVQFCFLASGLSLLVYYLTNNPRCATNLSTSSMGGPLRPTGDDKLHICVTGGAGFIGSHAVQRLLHDGHAVTAIDNLSRGNIGAIRVLQQLAHPDQFQFVEADLGDGSLVTKIFIDSQFDLVMHFAAIAYVGAPLDLPALRAPPLP
jgi:hypothetical protein